MKQVIKIIHDSSASGNYYDGSVLRLTGINNASDVDGDVLMTNDCYKEIFSIHKKIAKNYQKRLSIVKISANGHSIYRTFKGVPAKYFSNNFAALSPNSIMQLFDENGIPPKEVELKKGSIIPFYMFHPDKAVRLSFKMGLISIFLGVTSFIISIIGLL